MSYNIIAGVSQRFYHTVPDDLDLITTSPTREGIFQYLSQIEYNKFPEFILDLLVKVEGHTPIDVTDGQGDEKQDIFTINPKGERCLTQCKHTSNYKEHYNGDDLDLMIAACLRKDCKEGIFATNADLTPQGKKYVNDKEYNRGIHSKKDQRQIEYWNGYKIWDKIKNNGDIINKWFGNLGQVHSLRSFKFDLTVQQMPHADTAAVNEKDVFDNLLDAIVVCPWVKEVEKGQLYEAELSDNYRVKIKKWYQFTGNLDINVMPASNTLDFLNKAVYALTISVDMVQGNKFSPKHLRDEIVLRLADEVLPPASDDKVWWHFVASQVKSFIYIHDISEPREIDLSTAATFVKVGRQKAAREQKYCADLGEKFKVVENEEDYKLVHKATNINVTLLFEQNLNPVQQYNNQLIQLKELEKLHTYKFYAVKGINLSMMMRLRKLLYYEWTVINHDNSTLIWAEDPKTDSAIVEEVHTKIEALSLNILKVKDEDVTFILKNVQKDLVPPDWMYNSDLSVLSYPVYLQKRVFMLQKDIKCRRLNIDVQMELLKFKLNYESRHGFDNFGEETEIKLNTKELPGLLFELFSFRGNRMVDIGIQKDRISVFARYREYKLDDSSTLTMEYIKDFKNLLSSLKKIIT